VTRTGSRGIQAVIAAALLLSAGISASAQEVLLSTAESYYGFLALDGSCERPYLNYRTLSDSVWATGNAAGNIWRDNRLGTSRSLSDKVKFRIYGPELFTSYNSAAPSGQNDGVLWQGKGFNSSLSAGIRLEAYGFELTLKPVVAYSQNLAFDLVSPSAYYSSYTGKAAEYGYYGLAYVDAPQRFGDEPFFSYSWGDSEIRYAWKTLTAGFGTQSIWLGPAKINPIIHSNNAPPYPKIDVGLRKTAVTLPFLGWYAGNVEARAWWGKTTESDWFNNDSSDDSNLITGLTVSYAPSFAPSLTLGFNRTMLSKWSALEYNWDNFLTLLVPMMEMNAGWDDSDQRASLTIEYGIPRAGLDLYAEWARNDFSGDLDLILRYPFHSSGWTIGSVKRFSLFCLPASFCFEITTLESSRDYELLWPASFYAHHLIRQGYTNGGQWLAAGMGTGGNSQYAGLTLYQKRGKLNFFIQRTNPDNDYVWFMDMGEEISVDSDGDGKTKRMDEYKLKAVYSAGISATRFLLDHLELKSGLVISDIQNPLYESSSANYVKSAHLLNIYANIGVAYQF